MTWSAATSMSRRWINISFRRPAIRSAIFNVMISPSGTQALVRNLLGTRGIDLFIGEPDMIGHGHGPILIGRFVDNLLQKGLPRVVTDPDPANSHAIRAYEKAGFEKDRMIETPGGPAFLMVRSA
jgi:RimJ/RimL family protein N-acetyltransferase